MLFDLSSPLVIYLMHLNHLKMQTFFSPYTLAKGMIKHTFIILKGIGNTTERTLWQEGILTWDDFVSKRKVRRISSKRKKNYDFQLVKARENLEHENSSYFAHCLHSREHWRLYDQWKEKACFLDIETTGLSHGITVIGMYSSEGYKHYVRGIDLEREIIKQEIEKNNILVTFYGKAFDMPFIERELDISMDIPHIDLCFTGKKLGLRGGLKKVEQQIGIRRDADICGMDGFDAVLLWKKYLKGDDNALELLIKYNMADTVNLKVLADVICTRLKEETFFCAKEV